MSKKHYPIAPKLDELVDLLAEMVNFRNRLTDALFRGSSIRESNSMWEEVEHAQEALSRILTFIQERIMRLRMVPPVVKPFIEELVWSYNEIKEPKERG